MQPQKRTLNSEKSAELSDQEGNGSADMNDSQRSESGKRQSSVLECLPTKKIKLDTESSRSYVQEQNTAKREPSEAARRVAEQCLAALTAIAIQGDQFEGDTEVDAKVSLIQQYKKFQHQVIIGEEVLPNSQQNQISPIIFTKKQVQFMRNIKQMTPWMIAFENYLHIVAMLYYKRTFNLNDLLIIPDSTMGRDFYTKAQNGQISLIKQINRPGRKPIKKAPGAQTNVSTTVNTASKLVQAGDKTGSIEPQKGKPRGRWAKKKQEENQRQTIGVVIQQQQELTAVYENGDADVIQLPSNSIQQQVQDDRTADTLAQSGGGREDGGREDKNGDIEQNVGQQSILDSLISPLRVEYNFENWAPREIAVFEAALCKFGKQFGFIAEIVIENGGSGVRRT